MTKLRSPIKYYGGKSHMTSTLKDYFPKYFTSYIECFGGGGSLLFSKEQEGIEVYNDLGSNVYSLFKVLSDKELYMQLREKVDLTYYSARIREEFKEELKSNLTLLERAYKFLVVSRSSFNGVGGFSVTQSLSRKMCRATADFLSMIEGLEDVHNRLSSVVIENKDVFDLLDKYDSKSSFFYLDPPYVKGTRSSSTNYEVEMSNKEHIKLVQRLLQINGSFLLSGYNHDIYEPLTSKFGKIEIKAPNSKIERTEVLWKNY